MNVHAIPAEVLARPRSAPKREEEKGFPTKKRRLSLCTGDRQPERTVKLNVTLSHKIQQLRWQINYMAQVQQVTLALYMDADCSQLRGNSLLIDGSLHVCQ